MYREAGPDVLEGNKGQGITFTTAGGTLDGVTTGADLDLATNDGATGTVEDGLTLIGSATVRLGNTAGSTTGSLSFSGTQTLGGTGTVLFGKKSGNLLSVSVGAMLTIGNDITIRGSSGNITGNAILNQGTIAADDSGGGPPTASPTTRASAADRSPPHQPRSIPAA